MRKMETFVAIVDDDESVGLAIKRLLRSIVMRAEAFMGGEGFLDLISQARSYRRRPASLQWLRPLGQPRVGSTMRYFTGQSTHL